MDKADEKIFGELFKKASDGILGNSNNKIAIGGYVRRIILFFLAWSIILYFLVVRIKILRTDEVIGAGLNFILEGAISVINKSLFGFDSGVPEEIFILFTTLSYDNFISLLGVVVMFMIYFTVLGVFPLVALLSSKPIERLKSVLLWELLIVGMIIFIPLILYAFFGGGEADETQSGVDVAKEESVGFLDRIYNDYLCEVFNSVEECIKRRSQVQETFSNTESYLVSFRKSAKDEFTLEELVGSGFPANYELQSKGGTLSIEKLECYRDFVSPENLISTNFDVAQDIKFNSETPISFKCGINAFSVSEEEEDVKVKSVLYFSVKTRYDITIPIIDFEKYIESSENPEIDHTLVDYFSEIRDKYGSGERSATNNVLKSSSEQEILFPIIYSIEKEDQDSGEFRLILEESSAARIGDLVSAHVESIESQYVRSSPAKGEIFPYEVKATYNDKIIIPIDLEVPDDLIFNSDEKIYDLLSIEIVSRFKSEGTQDFRVIDENFNLQEDGPSNGIVDITFS